MLLSVSKYESSAQRDVLPAREAERKGLGNGK